MFCTLKNGVLSFLLLLSACAKLPDLVDHGSSTPVSESMTVAVNDDQVFVTITIAETEESAEYQPVYVENVDDLQTYKLIPMSRKPAYSIKKQVYVYDKAMFAGGIRMTITKGNTRLAM